VTVDASRALSFALGIRAQVSELLQPAGIKPELDQALLVRHEGEGRTALHQDPSVFAYGIDDRQFFAFQSSRQGRNYKIDDCAELAFVVGALGAKFVKLSFASVRANAQLRHRLAHLVRHEDAQRDLRGWQVVRVGVACAEEAEQDYLRD
jgi:hypothetical protein